MAERSVCIYSLSIDRVYVYRVYIYIFCIYTAPVEGCGGCGC